VLPGGGSETGAVSGASANNGNNESNQQAASTSSGSLPFTGEDVLKVILVGLLLAGGGLALGWRTRRSS
jgi:LPXTG-motif cell wall-anchored protein